MAIGGSAGSIEPLLELVQGLPESLAAAVLVVIHGGRGGHALPRILERAAALPVEEARDGQPVRVGQIYVPPADHHLLLADDHVSVTHGPEVNRTRPAIDPLFQSVAAHAGPLGVGVVLSGALDDGAAGLAAIHRAGGLAVVQDPDESAFPSMPGAALDLVPGARRVVRAGLAAAVVDAVEAAPRAQWSPSADDLKREVAALEIPLHPADPAQLGAPAVFGCPDCGGTLWELVGDAELRFRCRVGHGYTARSLLDAQSGNIERGLWIAIRALEEQAALAWRLARRAQASGDESACARFERQAISAENHAAAIRGILREEPGAIDAGTPTGTRGVAQAD